MGHARCQAAEHGKVSGALGFALQALTFGHFAAQGNSAFLHALFEFVVGLLECLFGLLTRRDIRRAMMPPAMSPLAFNNGPRLRMRWKV